MYTIALDVLLALAIPFTVFTFNGRDGRAAVLFSPPVPRVPGFVMMTAGDPIDGVIYPLTEAARMTKLQPQRLKRWFKGYGYTLRSGDRT